MAGAALSTGKAAAGRVQPDRDAEVPCAAGVQAELVAAVLGARRS